MNDVIGHGQRANPGPPPPSITRHVDLSGRHAIVTGASRGIGASMARCLDAAGANVVLVARRGDLLADVASTFSNEYQCIVADLGDIDSLPMVVEQVHDRWGGIDILVNNAGITAPQPADRVSPQTWQNILNVNLTSVFTLTQLAATSMKANGFGRVINIASVLGVLGEAWAAPYCATKAGVIGLTRSLATEWSGQGITVNALSPGWIHTDMVDDFAQDPQFSKRVISRTPVRRWGQPADLDGPLLLLASAQSSFITGHNLVVDGGLSTSW